MSARAGVIRLSIWCPLVESRRAARREERKRRRLCGCCCWSRHPPLQPSPGDSPNTFASKHGGCRLSRTLSLSLAHGLSGPCALSCFAPRAPFLAVFARCRLFSAVSLSLSHSGLSSRARVKGCPMCPRICAKEQRAPFPPAIASSPPIASDVRAIVCAIANPQIEPGTKADSGFGGQRASCILPGDDSERQVRRRTYAPCIHNQICSTTHASHFFLFLRRLLFADNCNTDVRPRSAPGIRTGAWSNSIRLSFCTFTPLCIRHGRVSCTHSPT